MADFQLFAKEHQEDAKFLATPPQSTQLSPMEEEEDVSLGTSEQFTGTNHPGDTPNSPFAAANLELL
ncbi:hypothetical protein OPQ81_005072 [Rhizoctonia solani]|nr:hypothetical protein OPQ81_005072 [Rhizoctonia solani]